MGRNILNHFKNEDIPYENSVIPVEFTLYNTGTNAAVERVFSIENDFWTRTPLDFLRPWTLTHKYSTPMTLKTKSPGLSVEYRSSRAHQTALARIRRGHLRSMTFVQGVKSFFTCPCSLPASPAHLLDCWGISLRQLYEEQDLV
ncbi:uncharacterized protein TNCV_3233121 [Trichonephila clavipes]|nr:uncharacterized protein TNCV_3233121 [Trichonephila clavipes]